MLTAAKITQGQAADYAEYLDGRSRPSVLGDYYLKDGDRVEAPGRWAAGAEAVGCDPNRPVRGEELRELLAVRRPDTGGPLRRVGGNGAAVAAIDATFSAPSRSARFGQSPTLLYGSGSSGRTSRRSTARSSTPPRWCR